MSARGHNYGTEGFLRKMIREKNQTLHRARDLLERVRDGEPYTTRDIETVLEFVTEEAKKV